MVKACVAGIVDGKRTTIEFEHVISMIVDTILIVPRPEGGGLVFCSDDPDILNVVISSDEIVSLIPEKKEK